MYPTLRKTLLRNAAKTTGPQLSVLYLKYKVNDTIKSMRKNSIGQIRKDCDELAVSVDLLSKKVNGLIAFNVLLVLVAGYFFIAQ